MDTLPAGQGAAAGALAILTRPAGRNEALAARLAEQGVPSLVLPALCLDPVPDIAVPAPQDFAMLMFVSGYAARCYFQSWRQAGAASWPRGVLAAAVGPSTVQVLRDAGVPSSALLHPDAESTQDSEALWQILQSRGLRPGRVLIVRGDSGRDWLADQLRADGTTVQCFAAYRRSPAVWTPSQAQALRQTGQKYARRIWLASSADSVRAIDANLTRLALQQLWRAGLAVTVHARIATVIRQLQQAAGGDGQSQIIISRPDEQALFQSMMALAKPS